MEGFNQIMPMNDAFILEDNDVSKNEYKVFIPALTPTIRRNSILEDKITIRKGRLVNKISGLKSNVLKTNYLVAKNISEYDVNMIGNYELDGDWHVTKLSGETVLKVLSAPTNIILADSLGKPVTGTANIIPLDFNKTADSSDMKSKGTFKFTDIHNSTSKKKISKGDKCIVSFVTNYDKVVINYIEGKVDKR